MDAVLLTRKAAPPPPLGCFGLEHDKKDPKCRACPHQKACVVKMGCREGRVMLNHVRFKLGELLQLAGEDVDAANVEDVYKDCYHRVFGKRRRPGWLKKEDAARLIVSVKRQGMTIRLYVYAAMLGFKCTSPDRRFLVAHLLGGAAEKNVEEYRRQAAREFGVFDMTTLLAVASNGQQENVGHTFVENEWLAARWIVGYRQMRGQGAITSLFDNKELALDPRWLATEPAYRRWLGSPDKLMTKELLRHRHRVSQVSPDVWRGLRQTILPQVLSRVLAEYAFKETDFEVISPIRQPLAFWSALGDAFLQVKTLMLLRARFL